jgi:hypothetical protein
MDLATLHFESCVSGGVVTDVRNEATFCSGSSHGQAKLYAMYT